MKLSDWAKKQGIAYLTAYRWFKDGKLPVKAYQSDSGTIIVQDDSETSEQAMAANATQNDAMALFLKKTVEYSQNNSTVSDFAAYILSTFQLKLNTVNEGPKYSRNKPKAEDVQKHFQQFIPKGEKPKPNSFVIEPDKLDELAAQSDSLSANQITAVPDTTGFQGTSVATSTNDLYTNLAAAFDGGSIVEGTVTRSVDLNTTPQQINYTGSTNSALNNSFTSSSVISGDVGGNSIVPNVANFMAPATAGAPSVFLAANSSFAFQPTTKELQTVGKVIETAEAPPRARRGRKPFKNKG